MCPDISLWCTQRITAILEKSNPWKLVRIQASMQELKLISISKFIYSHAGGWKVWVGAEVKKRSQKKLERA